MISLTRSGLLALALLLALGAASILAADLAAAQGAAGPAREEASKPILVVTADARAPQGSAAADQLRAKAGAKGRVRVMVRLRTTLRDEETLSPAAAARQQQGLRALQDQVIDRTLGGARARSVHRFTIVPFIATSVDASAIDRLIADPDVVSILEDLPAYPQLNESVPRIKAPFLWRKGFDGDGYAVAVLNSGIDPDHPMLAGALVSEACYSFTFDDPNFKSLCPGGAPSSTAAGSGRYCLLDIAFCEHGTGVAAIAVGNTAGLAGVAPLAKLISMQIYRKGINAEACPGRPSPCIVSSSVAQAAALERVYKLRRRFQIAAVNLSVGGGAYVVPCDGDPQTNPLSLIAAKLRAAGIAPIASSGNESSDGTINHPACLGPMIAVGATTDGDKVASFSNHSNLVKLMAPGVAIESAYPEGGYAVYEGTSHAAPHVAGAFALLKHARPAATVNDILNALVCTGKNVQRNGLKKPRIDLKRAFNLLKLGTENVAWQFDTPDGAADWIPFSLRGDWAVSGGHYSVPTSETGDAVTWFPGCFGDGTVTVRLRRGLTSPFPPGRVFANSTHLVFRLTVAGDPEEPTATYNYSLGYIQYANGDTTAMATLNPGNGSGGPLFGGFPRPAGPGASCLRRRASPTPGLMSSRWSPRVPR